jgi:hypothetical protein
MPRKTKAGEEWLQVVMKSDLKKRLKLESVRKGKTMGDVLSEILDSFLPSESDHTKDKTK